MWQLFLSSVFIDCKSLLHEILESSKESNTLSADVSRVMNALASLESEQNKVENYNIEKSSMEMLNTMINIFFSK